MIEFKIKPSKKKLADSMVLSAHFKWRIASTCQTIIGLLTIAGDLGCPLCDLFPTCSGCVPKNNYYSVCFEEWLKFDAYEGTDIKELQLLASHVADRIKTHFKL